MRSAGLPKCITEAYVHRQHFTGILRECGVPSQKIYGRTPDNSMPHVDVILAWTQ